MNNPSLQNRIEKTQEEIRLSLNPVNTTIRKISLRLHRRILDIDSI